MGRQPFRQMKNDGTMEEAGSSGGGDGTGLILPNITKTGKNGGTQSKYLPIIPIQSTNSFVNYSTFYFANKQYFIPFYSGTGGDLDTIIIRSGDVVWNGTAFASGGNGYQWSLFSADSDTGFPESSIIDTYEFKPESTNSEVSFDVRDNGSRITLTANTWYWLGFLGGSSSNNGNLKFNCFRGNYVLPLQMPASSNPAIFYYWDATQSSLKTSGFTINSNSNEFIAVQQNYVPRIFFTYLEDSNNNNRWA